MNQPVSTVMQVNAELAAQWLSTMQQNRRLSPKRVSWFVNLIERDEWQLTPDAIAFDTNGCLSNGQHRLTAIAQTDKTVPLLVIEGISTRAFMVMDTGQKRTPEQALQLLGYSNVDTLASSSRLVMLYYSNAMIRSASVRYTNDQIVAFVEKHPELPAWVSIAKNVRRHIHLAASATTAFCVIASPLSDDSELIDFIEPIRTGIDLRESDPRLALRRMLISPTSIKAGDSRNQHIQHLALLIKAFNAWAIGKPVDHFKYWKFSDNYPVVEGTNL